MNFTTGAIFVPSELSDRIIDFLWNTPVALRACSLTCRMWLPSSHFHMFRYKSVELRRRVDWELFETILRGSAEASTGLTNYIYSINILAFGNEEVDIESSWLALVEPGTMLHPLLAGLSAVRQLTIDGCDHGGANLAARYARLIHFLSNLTFIRSVTTLELRYTFYETHDDLMRILSACSPILASLHLRDCYVRHGPPPPVLPLPMSHISSGSMHRIRLDGDLRINVHCESSRFSTHWATPLWLLQGLIYDLCPRRLTWEGCVAVFNGLSLLRDLLQRTASSLEHVDLTLTLEEKRIREELVDLSPCHELVSARIRSSPCTDIHARGWIHAVLKQICSTRMRELRIAIALSSHDLVPRGMHWEGIDRNLCRLGELNPQMVVHFDCTIYLESLVGPPPESSAADLIADLEGHLPLSRKAGLRLAVNVNVDIDAPLW
ncbi:hypothetical protein B0H21DRAFT_88427 [Amylocystis lapponica]|nr:hypothetical protein B0H21DRAFT_88427 [Amylocystis lapponica]